MKTGLNIVELATELQRRSEAKQDFVAPTSRVHMETVDNAPQLVIENGQDRAFGITQHTHRQLGTWAKIPAKYYDQMIQSSPDLLATNVNHWLEESKAKRMIRTLDGDARAFLSDRYRRIDNEDVAEQVLPVLLESGNFSQIVSADVTASKLYIKALFPKIRGEVGVGDEVQAGVIISNSEIGAGSLQVQPLVYRLICTNGMISQDSSLRRYHVGRQVQGDGENALELFQDETIKADDRALMLKIRDIVRACADPAVFNAIVEKMRASKEGPQVTSPVAAVEVLAKSNGFNDTEKGTVLENLIRGQDYSRFGVLNAITATANTHEDYDRATEFEALGGKVLDLSPKDWKVVAEAA